MKEVRIRLEKKVLHLNLPSSMEEMTEEQFICAMQLQAGEAEQKQMFATLGIKPKVYRQLPVWVRISIMDGLDFMQDLSQPCTRMLIKRMPARKSLLACGDRLQGMCLQQFMAVDSYYSYFGVTEDVQHIKRMVASLYLAKGEGFIKDEEHPKLVDVDKRAQMIDAVPAYVIRSVLFNWIMIKNWLSLEFKHLFPKAESSGKPQPANWLELFDSFVGGDVPHMESYQKMECMDAFRIIDRKIQEQQKNKR